MLQQMALALMLLALTGCQETFLTSVPDLRPNMTIDPDASFSIEFGRGGGRDGLDTISIDETGTAIIYRMKKLDFHKATISLTKASLHQLLESIDKHGILSLDREYHKDIADGTQWVFLVTQGDKTKSIYFNNHFPDEIVKFASELDLLLDVKNRQLQWEEMGRSRDHENRLWAGIRD